jgi:hypothetical protein
MCHHKLVTFSLCSFIFFGKSILKILESEHELGLIAFLQRGPQLRDISFQTVAYDPYLARVGSNEVDSILTRISATFLAAEREVSQNGNWFRVMSNIESFELPPRSVPSDVLTVTASCYTGVLAAAAADGSLAHAYPARCTRTGRPDPQTCHA